MDGVKRKKTKIILTISVIIFSSVVVTLSILNIGYLNSLQKKEESEPFIISTSGDFDPLEFWNSEMKRANDTDLNIDLDKKYDLPYTNPYTGKKFTFKAQEIAFDSPNWVGEDTLTLRGYLLFPEGFKSTSTYSGCLCMHGLNGNANASFGLAYQYLEQGFVVLCHSHPGHGESDGAQPTPENFYGGDEFNKDTHYYLTIMGAIQGMRVLENLTYVDNSSIVVTGGSYGALNTMWLSSIAGERIACAIPYIAIGDIKKNLDDPTKLLYWVWGKAPDEIPASFWKKQARWFDPKYYLISEKLPPIMWQIGTNDEFFIHTGINGTIDAVVKDDAYLQIYADGHHGLPNFENTTKYFIDYVLNGGSAPPKINLKEDTKSFSIFGDVLNFKVKVECKKDIKSVEIVYRYLDIIGSTWESVKLKETDDNIWTGTLTPGIITSDVHYYILVTLKGKEHVWFTSKIYTPGVLVSNSTIPFYIVVFAFIGVPIYYLVSRRYKKHVAELDLDLQEDASKKFKLEMALLTIANVTFFISIILPWVVFEGGGVTWNHIYIFNNLFTWKLIFGVFAPYLTVLYLIGWILTSQLSTIRPMLGGFFKIWYPIFVFLIFGVLLTTLSGGDPNSSALNFGIAYPGLGLYLMLFSSLSLFIIGIWKRKYQTRLGLHTPKTRWYNIDRWFRIKPIERELIEPELNESQKNETSE